MRTRNWLCAALLAAGCGGADISDTPIEVLPACNESGIACTWLGLPGEEGFNGDGHHRLATKLYWSMDMYFADDGTPWFIDWNNHLVRRVLPDDTVETVVGWIDPVFPGDGTGDGSELTEEGAYGLDVQLNHPTDLAQMPNGDILLMAWHNHKLRVIEPDTAHVRIVGGAGGGFAGDGAPVSEARFKQPTSVEMADDGNIYILDQQNMRIRRVDQDGMLSSIAGTGEQGYAGDGGPALEANFNWERGSNPEPGGGLAYADRKLYIGDTDNHRVRVMDLETGLIETVAGTGEPGYSGDGGAATEAQLNGPHDLEIGPEGDLYIADADNHVIRAVDLDSGEIRTVAGTGELGLDEDEALPATEYRLRRPFGIAFDHDGNLYIMDTINSRIVRVTR